MLWSPQLSYTTNTAERGYCTDGAGTVWRASYQSGTGIVVAKSVDEGQTYAADVLVSAAGNDVFLDKPFVRDQVTGTLHLTYGKNIDTGGSPAVLAHRSSTDGGATWSAEHVIDDGVAHGNNRFLRVTIVAYNGKLNVWYTSATNGAPFDTDGIWLSESTNAGATWTAPSEPYTAGLVCPIRPNSKIGPDGTVIVAFEDPGVFDGAAPGDIWILKSTDFGVTWPNAPVKITTTTNYGRPDIDGDNGTWVITAMRPFGNGINSDVYTMRSTDNGATWSAPALLASHTASFSLTHPIVEMQGATVVLAYGIADNSGSPGPMTSTSWISTDAGANWTAAGVPLTFTNISVTDVRLCQTGNMFLCAGADTTSAQFVESRLPLFAFDPAGTLTTLDDFNRADNATPPPSASWSLWSGSAGEGLAQLGNMAVRKATGTSRQGDYYNVSTVGTPAEIIETVGVSGSLTVAADLWTLGITGASDTAESSMTGYQVDLTSGPGFWRVAFNRFAAGVYQATPFFTGDLGFTPAGGDKVRVRRIGNMWLFFYYQASAADWKLLGTVVESTVAGPYRLALDLVNSQVPRYDQLDAATITVPSNSGTPTISGSGTLTAADGTWSTTNGASPAWYSYQWQQSSDNVSYTSVTNAALQFHVPTMGGRYYRVGVTAHNSVGTATAYSAGTVVFVAGLTIPMNVGARW